MKVKLSQIKFYYFVSQYDTLFYVACGSFPCLRNKKEKKKRILLYALTARLPYGDSPPITILRQMTFKYNAFSIEQPFMKLKEMEQKMFGKPKFRPKLVIFDYRKETLKPSQEQLLNLLCSTNTCELYMLH